MPFGAFYIGIQLDFQVVIKSAANAASPAAENIVQSSSPREAGDKDVGLRNLFTSKAARTTDR